MATVIVASSLKAVPLLFMPLYATLSILISLVLFAIRLYGRGSDIPRFGWIVLGTAEKNRRHVLTGIQPEFSLNPSR